MTFALLFFLPIIFSTVKASEQDRLTAMALDLLATGYKDPNPPFERLHDDVYCNDGDSSRIFTRTNIQMKDCKSACSDNEACKYFAFWIKSKKCEGYETCEVQVPGGNHKIAVYIKVSPCEMLLPNYVDSIVMQFKPHTLRPLHLPFEWQKSQPPRSAYPNPNFLCKCIGTIWMICPIFLPNSAGEDFDAVGERLDLTNLEKMTPFFLLNTDLKKYGGEGAFLAFLEPPPRAIAEIEIIDHLSDEGVAGCIHMRQCVEGTPNGREPIRGSFFKSGEAVWILLRDYPKIRRGMPVGCISTKGIRTWVLRESSQLEGGFVDPLGRFDPVQPLNLDEHFVMLIVFDKDALLTGICGKHFMEEASEQTQLEAVEQAAEIEKLTDGLELLSTGKKKGKKKKKSKGGSSSAADSSSSGISARSPQPSLLGMLEGSNSPLQGDSPDLMQSAAGAIRAPQLSQADLQKMRKSFEEAKARRASSKASDDRVATVYGSLSMRHLVYITIALLFILLICQWTFETKESEQDAYIIF